MTEGDKSDQGDASKLSTSTGDELHLPSQLLRQLLDDTEGLWCPRHVDIMEEEMDALTLLRDYVVKSRPCILRGALARLALTLDDLVNLARDDLELLVDVTPNGFGDALHVVQEGPGCSQKVHVRPLPVRMTMDDFRRRLRRSRAETSASSSFPVCLDDSHTITTASRLDLAPAAVYYFSQQDDNLRQDLRPLWERLDIPEHPYEQVFGNASAINLWVGNEHATSSWHKDHYENLYYVASGEKVFTLCPPSNALFLPEECVRGGQFVLDENNQWTVRLDDNNVRWIGADPLGRHAEEHLQQYPWLRYATTLEVRVQAGDLLYLPSLWFHRVTQSCETVAVNWWYDMAFDSPQWTYFHFLQSMALASKSGDAPEE